MKAGTESKLKFKLLMKRLRLPLYQARGLLDTFWSFVQNNAPDGEVTRFSNEEIALAIDWERDADELMQALVDLRWVDEETPGGRTPGAENSPRAYRGRLFVHDWKEHCEESVHRALARAGRRFAQCGSVPNMSRLTKDERAKCEALFADNAQTDAATPAVRPAGVRGTPAVSPSLALPCHYQAITKPSPGGEGAGAMTDEEPKPDNRPEPKPSDPPRPGTPVDPEHAVALAALGPCGEPTTREALVRWAKHVRESKSDAHTGRVRALRPDQIEALCRDFAGRRVPPERLVAWIDGSIARDWKTINDPDTRPGPRAPPGDQMETLPEIKPRRRSASA